MATRRSTLPWLLAGLLLVLAGRAAAADPPEPADPVDGRFWVFGRDASIFEQSDERVATRVGGWLDLSYLDNDRPGESGSFNVNHVNLFLDTRFRSWQFFVEGEYEDQTDLTGFEAEREGELEQAFLRYRHGDDLSLRIGRFNTPFGFWLPIHWTILMDTVARPLYVGLEVIPEQQVGAEIEGQLLSLGPSWQDAELRWSAYVGAGGDDIGQSEIDGPTVGGDLRLEVADRILLGASVYRERNADFDDRTELSGVLYGEALLMKNLVLRSEWVAQHRDTKRFGYKPDVDWFYVKLRWDLHPMVYLNYRFDYGDQDEEDLDKTVGRRVHTFTLGLRPHRAVRVRFEYAHEDYWGVSGQDFDYWGIWAGVLF